jgi:hypothetical protein
MGLFGELWDDAKQGLGDVVNDGTHVLGDGLNLVGLHGAADAVETEGDKIGYSLGANVGELQLGQTSDPVMLVHGAPAAIRSAAAKLKSFSSGFGETAGGLRGTAIERETSAIFVGEPTGSRPNFIGERIDFELPYSKVLANAGDLFWQTSWPKDARIWTAPDIYAPPTFEAFRRNEDPALDAILAIREHVPIQTRI